MNCTERTGRLEEGKKETLLLPFLLSFLSFFQLCSAVPTFICCHSYHGAVHFSSAPIWFAARPIPTPPSSATHSVLALRLGCFSPPEQSRATFKEPPPLWVNPLVFPLVSIVCVSGTRWQYLWCLSWSGRVLFLLDLISENRLKPHCCVLSGGCKIGRRRSVSLIVGSCRNWFSHQAVFFFINFLFSLMSGPRAPVMTVIQLEWICWW